MNALAQKFNTYKSFIKELLNLSYPIMAGNLAAMLIGVGDVIVAGRHSTLTLGAISVATAIFMTLLIAAMGLVASISPVVSNLRGARISTKTLFRTTVKYSLAVALIFCAIIRFSVHHLEFLGLNEDLFPLVVEYLDISSWGLFGGLLFAALKEFLQAYEIVKFPNIVVVFQIFLNLFLNIALVFGVWGFPELGVKGLAIASLIVRTLGGLALFVYCIPFLKGKSNRARSYVKDLLKIGWPISFALFFEFLGFNITAVLMGKFSALLTAAHNVIITLSSITYMFPMSVASAMSIKIGFANGENNILNLKRYINSGFLITIAFVCLMFGTLALFSKELLLIFTNDIEVVKTALPVMAIVMCFLLFDGLQCWARGALQGLKDTKPIMFTMGISYLVVAIPVGCILAFKYNIVLIGFWIGLALALFSASAILSLILLKKIKKLEMQKL